MWDQGDDASQTSACVATPFETRQVGEDQLRRIHAAETAGRMACSLVHDFRNLVTVIRACASAVEQRSDSGNPTYEDATEILRTADRAAELLTDILKVGQPAASEERTELNQVLRDVEPTLRRVLRPGLALAVHASLLPCIVPLSSLTLERMILNLVLNGCDAISGTGRISVSLDTAPAPSNKNTRLTDGMYAVLSVSDTGHGISPDVAERVFDAFFTTKSSDASGLGLSTVRDLVRGVGGEVLLDSVPNSGTTVRVYLPMTRSMSAGEAPSPTARLERSAAPAAPDAVDRERGVILIADDEAVVRSGIRRLLEREGFVTLEAANGREALTAARLNAAAISLVITDVIMPELSGPEFVRQMRAGGIHPPVLYISGYVAEQGAAAIQESGDQLLRKPFAAVDLIHAVRQRLDHAKNVGACTP